jgi:hypothetical protein
MIMPKAKKYNVMRLATVGCQKEQKHLMCSKIFIVVAFDKFAGGRIHQFLYPG